MPRESERRLQPGGITAIGTGLFLLLPIVYALSLGPAIWLATNNYITVTRLTLVIGPFARLLTFARLLVIQFTAMWTFGMVTDTEKKRRSNFSLAAILVACGLLPLGYVLSVGPVAWLHHRGYIQATPGSAIHAFYWPLDWLSQQSDSIALFFIWYEGLWK